MEKILDKTQKGFYFFENQSGSHGHRKNRIWVHASLVNKDSVTIEFPLKNSKITKTEKGSYVLHPDKDFNVYYVSIESGYRGWAKIDTVKQGEMIISDEIYHSEQGSLGCTDWGFVNSSNYYIEVTGRKTGRRVDNENVHIKIDIEGNVREEEPEDAVELLK